MISHGSYYGLYINLDRSLERRHRFETELAELGIEHRYAHFPAVDGRVLNFSGSPLKPSDVGVFLSHHRALEQARKSGKSVHIVEDGALLSRHVVPVIEDAVAANLFERYDLLFTDMMVHGQFGFLKSLKAEFDRTEVPKSGRLGLHQLQIVDLIPGPDAAFQSYVVGAGAIDRLLALYRREIETGLKAPVGVFIQQQVLAGHLKAACVFPFITSFRLEDMHENPIAESYEWPDRSTVTAVLRYLFYVGCDLDHAIRILDTATPSNRKATDLRHALLTKATEFARSEDFART